MENKFKLFIFTIVIFIMLMGCLPSFLAAQPTSTPVPTITPSFERIYFHVDLDVTSMQNARAIATQIAPIHARGRDAIVAACGESDYSLYNEDEICFELFYAREGKK